MVPSLALCVCRVETEKQKAASVLFNHIKHKGLEAANAHSTAQHDSGTVGRVRNMGDADCVPCGMKEGVQIECTAVRWWQMVAHKTSHNRPAVANTGRRGDKNNRPPRPNKVKRTPLFSRINVGRGGCVLTQAEEEEMRCTGIAALRYRTECVLGCLSAAYLIVNVPVLVCSTHCRRDPKEEGVRSNDDARGETQPEETPQGTMPHVVGKERNECG